MTAGRAGAEAGQPAHVPAPSYAIVIPTLGRPYLQACLDALAAAAGPPPHQVVLADDRPATPDPLPVRLPVPLAARTSAVTVGGRGPAAARNAGWRAATACEWIVFLDDDVRPGPSWAGELAADLAAAAPNVGGVQGVITVPPPSGRRPTDAERATMSLESAAWITADMALRRAALVDAGGFDERFPRPFREDSDLALRLQDLGWRLRRGQRRTVHPLRPGGTWGSLRAQAGNADDAAMSRRHGRGWRQRAGAPTGRRPAHVLTCGLAGAALALLAAGRRREAAAAVAGWLALTAEFAAERIARGPLTAREVTAMAVTSAAIPPLAVGHWLAGSWRYRADRPWPPRPAAVLFDRDGTLVRDVPYNADPALVEPVPGAAAALARLRRAGIRTGVVTNQAGIAKGLLTAAEADAVNRRVDDLLGPFGTWQVCPHGPGDGCRCRKPAPGMIIAAAAALSVEPAGCVVIGDTGADVTAARAAGARGILVPAPATLAAERLGVPCAESLPEAVEAVLDGRRLPSWPAGAPEPARSQPG